MPSLARAASRRPPSPRRGAFRPALHDPAYRRLKSLEPSGGHPAPRTPVLRAVPGLASLPFVLATLAFSPVSRRGGMGSLPSLSPAPGGRIRRSWRQGVALGSVLWLLGVSCVRSVSCVRFRSLAAFRVPVWPVPPGGAPWSPWPHRPGVLLVACPSRLAAELAIGDCSRLEGFQEPVSASLVLPAPTLRLISQVSGF